MQAAEIAKDWVGIKSITQDSLTFWAVTFNQAVLGDSRFHDCRQGAITEAQALVRADAQYRQMEIV